MNEYLVEHNGYLLSTNPARLQVEAVHAYLSQESYWAKGIPLAVVQRSIKNSLCFGVYTTTNQQVGFARVVSDLATFAYLADVFILEAHRGQGLSKWLMECIMQHPELQGLRRWSLATLDAHGLYTQFGFTPLAHPERMMEIARPRIYQQPEN